jgi:polar amino acid transport system substrate-binding protein
MQLYGTEIVLKRLLLTLAAGLLLGLAGLSSADAACEPKLGRPPLARKGYMIAAINPTVAPLQYIDDDGNIVGLNPEFGKEIAKRLCLTLELHSTQFATMIPLLKEGRIDMIDSFMFYTPERASQVIMVPYGAATTALVVPKKNTDAITAIEYFSGKRFGTELGTVDYTTAKRASEALERAGKPPIDVRTFGTYADVLQALSAGQLDGAFIGTEQAGWYAKKGVDFFRVALDDLDPIAEALAFKDPTLAEAVVKVLNEMKADGTFDRIFKAYDHCVLPGPYKVTTGPIPTPTCGGKSR